MRSSFSSSIILLVVARDIRLLNRKQDSFLNFLKTPIYSEFRKMIKMSLKKINDEIIQTVTERQKKLEELCDEFNINISKLEGMTNSVIIISMLKSLKLLMTVTKDQLDFTRSGFDLFLEEMRSINQQIEKYHGLAEDDRR